MLLNFIYLIIGVLIGAAGMFFLLFKITEKILKEKGEDVVKSYAEEGIDYIKDNMEGEDE